MFRLLYIVITLLSVSQGANILGIFPLPYYSHTRYHEKLVTALLHRGHTVTVLVEGKFKNHVNLTQINLKASQSLNNFDVFSRRDTIKGFNYLQILWLGYSSLSKALEHKKVQKLIRNEENLHFDVIISETVGPMALNYLAEVFDCPIIVSSAASPSSYVYKTIGVDVNTALAVESALFSHDVRSASLLERLEALMFFTVGFGILAPLVELNVAMDRSKYFPNQTATLKQNEDRISLILTNTHPALGYVRPTINTVQIGFFDVASPKPLPDGDLKNFLDGSQQKIIVVSFGTLTGASSMDSEIVQTFMRVFGQLDYLFVWKLPGTVRDKPPNVFTSEWIPQIDLLALPKTKLFITHGGLNSIQEAIDRTIPMLVLPIFCDQHFNAENVRRKGLGIVLKFKQLNEDTLLKSIQEALNPEFKVNLRKIRKMVYDQPVPGKELAVWWVEHVIKHKGLHHYEYRGREVSFCRKYCIDLLLLAVTTCVVLKKICGFLRSTSCNIWNKKVKAM